MGIAYNTSIIRNGLLLYLDAANRKSYPGSANTWLDQSGNANNITFVDGFTYNSNGSFTFDGTANRAQGAPSIKWSADGTIGTSTFTIDLWINTADTSGNYYSKPWNGSGQYNIRITPSSFIVGTTTTNTISFPSTSNSTWNNIVCWANSTVYGYNINGGANTSSSAHGLTGAAPSLGDDGLNTCFMSIYPYPNSGWSGNSTYSVAGSMASCKVYNRVLTNAEIQQNFNAFRGRYGI